MKKSAFLVAFGAIFISSCKKNYNCTCTTQIPGTSLSSTTVRVIPGTTHQVAAGVCESYEVYTQGSSQITTCSL